MRTVQSKLRACWASMIVRCTDETHPAYKNYGGRGITVDLRWLSSFAAFHDWSLLHGYVNNARLTIERINNNGPYSPENCEWTTYKKQNRNRRDNRLLTAFGERKCFADWLEDSRCLATRSAIKDRVAKGESFETAMGRPSRARNGRYAREPWSEEVRRKIAAAVRANPRRSRAWCIECHERHPIPPSALCPACDRRTPAAQELKEMGP